jgi:hypothetical protein
LREPGWGQRRDHSSLASSGRGAGSTMGRRYEPGNPVSMSDPA